MRASPCCRALTGPPAQTLPGEKSLTQAFTGPLEDDTYLTRGYETPSKVRAARPSSCFRP